MKTIERLPESELEVMLTLWHNETPLTVGEITKLLADAHNWKTATVHVLMDRLGAKTASVYTLVTAAVLYLFSGHPIPGILAVFLFNMTMPVTLWAVAQITPGMKGFTFGLLTFGLFIGYLPSAFGLPSLLVNYPLYSLVTLGSLFLLLMVYRAFRKGNLSC